MVWRKIINTPTSKQLQTWRRGGNTGATRIVTKGLKNMQTRSGNNSTDSLQKQLY